MLTTVELLSENVAEIRLRYFDLLTSRGRCSASLTSFVPVIVQITVADAVTDTNADYLHARVCVCVEPVYSYFFTVTDNKVLFYYLFSQCERAAALSPLP